MFKLYNNNPHNERLSDCVCRAITKATGANYYDVMDMLEENSQNNGCDCLNVECYSKMLDDIGYESKDGNGKSVEDIVDEHKDKTLLLRLDGHLTCSVNGDIYDLWDTSRKQVEKYWIVS